jgi:large repetitive protein
MARSGSSWRRVVFLAWILWGAAACVVDPEADRMRDGGGGGGGGVLPPPPPPPPVEPDPVLLVPGLSLRATLPAGDVDTLLFDAEVGCWVMLNVVDLEEEAVSRITLYRPDGSVAETRSGSSLVRFSFSAAQAGRYQVVVENTASSAPPGASYDVHFVLAPGANRGGELAPGGAVDGALSVGGLESYTFKAMVGEGVQLRAADLDGGGLSPGVAVFRPDGSLLDSASGDLVAAMSFSAPHEGTYTVVVYDASYYRNKVGSFRLYYTLAPGANAGGGLAPGGMVSGVLDLGELESFTFTAFAGQGVRVRVADVVGGDLSPGLAVYRPDGGLLDSASGNRVAAMSFSAPHDGTYTVVVYDASYYRDGAGAFRLYYTIAPGANTGGGLVSGGMVSGVLDVGELESFTFTAVMGQGIHVRVADVVAGDLSPGFTVYRPDGGVQNLASGDRVAAMSFSAPQDGTYTVVVYDASYYRDAAGAFRLYYTLAPGANAGGALVPGGMVSGVLDVGELESFTFTASVGQGVRARVADVVGGGLSPGFTVYRPDGGVLDSTSGDRVAALSLSAPQDGTYTVVVYDASYYRDAAGAFRLYYTLAPGANAGGALVPGGMVSGVLDVGELESFTFTASVGQGVRVRVADVVGGGLSPGFTVYRPDGGVLDLGSGDRVAVMSFSAPQSGTYTVVVYDASYYADDSGAFRLYYTLAPGANAGGVLSVGSTAAGTLDLGELESFTIAASAGQPLTVRVSETTSTNLTPGFTLYQPGGAVEISRSGATSASYSFTPTQSGTYTLVLFDASLYSDNVGQFNVLLTTP